MNHIPQEELLRTIEQEHQQLFESNLNSEVGKRDKFKQKEMSSIFPTTCSSLKDRNNNSVTTEDEDEVQAVLITGL